MTDRERAALEWLLDGETGASSEVIWRHMMGFAQCPNRGVRHPSDRGDFGRCAKLLDRMPEWRSRMVELELLGGWGPLVRAWDELTELWAGGRVSELNRRVYEIVYNVDPRPRKP